MSIIFRSICKKHLFAVIADTRITHGSTGIINQKAQFIRFYIPDAEPPLRSIGHPLRTGAVVTKIGVPMAVSNIIAGGKNNLIKLPVFSRA